MNFIFGGRRRSTAQRWPRPAAPKNRFPGVVDAIAILHASGHRSWFVLFRTGSSWGHRAQSKASEIMEHHALDRRHIAKTSVALRTVAIFDVTKAAILLLGCGLFHLMHRNLA